MEVSSQAHVSVALPPKKKNLRYSVARNLGGASGRPGRFGGNNTDRSHFRE